MNREKNSITIKRKTFYALIFFACLSLGWGLQVVGLVAAKENGAVDSYAQLKTFTDVLALVEKNYVERVDTKEMIEGAIKGMLISLDPHSSYMTPESYKDLQVETKGEFGGLGIEITVKDGLLTVVSPIEDSPASRAGLQPGDQIIKIADEFTKDLSLLDAIKKMRGPKGTPITISVHRDGYKELLSITVVRDIIKVKSVRSRMLDEGHGYIRLAQFQEGSAEEFSAALKELAQKPKDKKLHGLVIDLRNNPGGLLTQAIRVSDLFLKDGIVVYTDGRLESQKQKYYAHDDGSEPEIPMVVLVNNGSASASEILAGALQDSGRALILGTQSFGKGSVQTILPMESGSALRLTTALYFTRNGRSIQAQGIVPDVIVPARRFPKDSEELLEEDETIFPSKEKDLPGALKNPKGTTGPGAKPEMIRPLESAPKKKGEKTESHPIGSRSIIDLDLDTWLKEDPQLEEALRLLKTWRVFQGGKPAVSAMLSDRQPSS